MKRALSEAEERKNEPPSVCWPKAGDAHLTHRGLYRFQNEPGDS